MNVHTIVVLAAALAAVCDVSSAAQPAVIKSIQPQAERVTVSTAPEQSLRNAGQQAQQAIVRDAMHELAADALVMPSVNFIMAEAVEQEPALAEAARAGAQLAVK